MNRADDFHEAADEGLVQPGQGDPGSIERRVDHATGDVRGGGHPEQLDREGAAAPADPESLDDEFAGAPTEGPEGSDGQDDGSIA